MHGYGGMWIEEIFIESFGAFKGVAIRDFTPGLTVVLGVNEAGKSTALEFVRSVFFGFRKKTGFTNIYETPDGIPRCGWVTVGTRSGDRIRIHRQEKRGRREGMLSVTDEAGNLLDPSAVSLFRAGLDRNLYENLFAFDLDAMRRLDQEALRGKIVAAALGSAMVNPLVVVRKVDDRLKAVMGTARGGADSILSLQTRLREVEAGLRVLRDKPQRYAQLRRELEDVDLRREALGKEMMEKGARLKELSRTLRHEQDWKRVVALDAELGFLEDAREFPPDGIVRLERALEQQSEALRTVMELEAGLERLRSRYEAIVPDEAVLARADAIDGLVAEAKRLAGVPQEIDRLRAKKERSLAALEAEISDLGSGWDRERVVEIDPSQASEREIRLFIDLLNSARQKKVELEPRLFECREQYKRLRASIQRKRSHVEQLSPLCRGALSRESQRRLHQWILSRNRVSDLEERLSEKVRKLRNLVADRESVDERVRRMERETKRVVSPLVFWAAQAILVTAAAGMAGAAQDAEGMTFYAFVSISLLLILLIPASIRWNLLTERTRRNGLAEELSVLAGRRSAITRELAETEQERRTIVASIRELQQTMAEIGRDVLGNPRADMGDVLAAGKRSAEAEEPARRRRVVEDVLESESADLEVEESRGREIKSLMEEAERDIALALAQWRDFLCSTGLDVEWEPEEALTKVVRLRDICARLREIREDEEHLAAIESEWSDFSARVREVGLRLSGEDGSDLPPASNTDSRAEALPVAASAGRFDVKNGQDCLRSTDMRAYGPTVGPLELIEHWKRREEEAREKLAEKRALAERIEDQESNLVVSGKRIEEAGNRMAALLAAAGVTEEEAFRSQGFRHQHRNALLREREVLLRSLLSGDAADGQALDMTGYDWDADRELERALNRELDELRPASEELANKKGSLGKEIESIEAEEEFEKLLAEREELRARFVRSVHEWTKLRAASLLLRKTLRIYESEKQPKVLRRGSEIFGAITGGAFRRVLFPLDEDRVKVERSDGTRVDEGQLSRGTLEQVFLSLRLAHLDVYHGREALPLMMDDILVNFDCRRASRTASALARYAKESRRQVLFFTCHEHIADLFPSETKRLILGPDGPKTTDAYASVH